MKTFLYVVCICSLIRASGNLSKIARITTEHNQRNLAALALCGDVLFLTWGLCLLFL